MQAVWPSADRSDKTDLCLHSQVPTSVSGKKWCNIEPKLGDVCGGAALVTYEERRCGPIC